MKTASELYPKYAEEKDFYGPSDYQPIIDEFGEVLLQIDDGDYDGDSRILYRKDGKFGWLQFGWGSCSGCDALQACTDISDIQELMDELSEQIMWFEDKESAIIFFETHDWKGDYSWHTSNQKTFVKDAIALLKSM